MKNRQGNLAVLRLFKAEGKIFCCLEVGKTSSQGATTWHTQSAD